MVTATFHMEIKKDIYNFEGTELIKERQEEIEALTDTLNKFKPTIIAVEVPKKEQEKISKDYENYNEGDLSSLDEVVQVAFRLGKKSGLSDIKAVDWM